MKNENLNEPIDYYYNIAKASIDKSMGIGTQKEKILHRTIKYYLTLDESCFEHKVDSFIVDVYKENIIFEIQTSAFMRLVPKLTHLLKTHKVTVVYPTFERKMIYKTNPETGEITGPRKSPINGYFETFIELYRIRPFLLHPNFSLKLLVFDLDEYRTSCEKEYHFSKGYTKEIDIPKRLVCEYNFITPVDYLSFISEDNLSKPFTLKDFVSSNHITIKQAGITIRVLEGLGICQRIGKLGRSFLYQIKK